VDETAVLRAGEFRDPGHRQGEHRGRSRSRDPGTVSFCVTGVVHGNLACAPGSSLETCEAIT
jgi:hypothetical protein